MKEAEEVKSEFGFELGRFELTSKSVQTFPKSYAGRIRDGSTFAYKSKDWSKMIQSRIWINGSSDAKFCQLSNGALAFWIRNLVMEQNGFFWLDPIPFHEFLDVRKKLSIVTVCILDSSFYAPWSVVGNACMRSGHALTGNDGGPRWSANAWACCIL